MSTVTTSPMTDAITGRMVLLVEYSARLNRCVTASRGTDSAKAPSSIVVSSTSSASNASPPRNSSTAKPPTSHKPTAAASESTLMVTRLVTTSRVKRARSPSAAAADITGNAVTAKATPMSATGTLWKLRAKLTELMLPATKVDATEVKKRNVSGSMGWAMALGMARRRYCRKPLLLLASAGR